MSNQAVIAFLGQAGWYEHGRSECGTFSRSAPGGLDEVTAPIRVDLRPILDCEDPVLKVWKRPNLDLSLPDGNVRNLFEGCIGHEGTTKGHEWDGNLEGLQSFDSVGLNVYIAILKSQGAILLEEENE